MTSRIHDFNEISNILPNAIINQDVKMLNWLIGAYKLNLLIRSDVLLNLLNKSINKHINKRIAEVTRDRLIACDNKLYLSFNKEILRYSLNLLPNCQFDLLYISTKSTPEYLSDAENKEICKSIRDEILDFQREIEKERNEKHGIVRLNLDRYLIEDIIKLINTYVLLD